MPRQLLADYPRDNARYDEMFVAPGQPHPHARALFERLCLSASPELREALTEADRLILENGVTYNVYNDEQGANRPWTLDPLPLVLSPQEWQVIEQAVAQRAALLNCILLDLYGPQRLLEQRLLPPALVYGQPGFLRPAAGLHPVGGVMLHFYAADLARAPDGRWWVIGDRTQVPSGAGYALENRLIVSRLFPDLFRDLRVQHLAGFFAAARDALSHYAPRDDEPVTTVLLTPGPYNETYFEHAYLARYLGFPLVEGQDLTVRDGCVWLKTLSGLRRVHAILRRLDDDYCDPLELRADSALGIPGLTDAIRRGNVLIANGLGSGLVENGALAGFLPGLCQRLLGETLKLPSVASWWCGEPPALEEALRLSDHLVFKSAMPHLRFGPVFGQDLDSAGRVRLEQRVRAAPHEYVAQELVALSRAPVLDRSGNRRLLARSVGLRVFAVATPSGYQVMPGGLARTSSQADGRILSNQRGGGSKDVWVCTEGPVTNFSLLRRHVSAADLVRSGPGLSSRVVENLFWFGRYADRCDNLARLLRIALGRLVDDTPYVEDREWPGIAALCRRLGLLPPNSEPLSEERAGRELARCVFDVGQSNGLAACVRQFERSGFHLRERLSADNWRVLNGMVQMIDPHAAEGTGLVEAMAVLDRLIGSFMTLSGFTLDGMTRDHGWRFLSLGRRIERLQFYAQALECALEDGAAGGLEWLLELADSIVTYRSRYMARPQWLPVIDLLVADETNPRAIVFQTAGLRDYLTRLSAALGPMPLEQLEQLHGRLLVLDAGTDFAPESPALRALLRELRQMAYLLSEQLGLRFFSHSEFSAT